MASLSNLTSTLTSALSNLPPPDQIQDAERMQLIGAIDKIRAELEPPQLAMQRFCFSHYAIVVIRVAQGMGIFDTFFVTEGKELTLKELSSQTKGDEKLLKRILRFLCAHKICKETSPETYQPLPLGMAFGTGSVPGDMIKHFHTNMQVTAKLHEYFEKNNYTNPSDAYNAPFQLAYNTNDHYFTWLQDHPDVQKAFNSVMTESQKFRGTDWFDLYPVTEKLAVESERVLLVDIGGGVGHDLSAFKSRFPELPGKLVLQDLPQVVDSVTNPLEGGISVMGHNMFDAQPVKGAKAYYMRTVLHDFPDKQALEALGRIREGMDQDSVLLIHEHVTPEGEVPPLAAILDIHMMEIFSSLERTEREWVDLLEKAGFKVEKAWKGTDGHSAALFEAVLA